PVAQRRTKKAVNRAGAPKRQRVATKTTVQQTAVSAGAIKPGFDAAAAPGKTQVKKEQQQAAKCASATKTAASTRRAATVAMAKAAAANRSKGANKPRTKSSRFVGVSIYKRTGRYVAQIKHFGHRQHLGYYSNELDAKAAYDRAVAKLAINPDHDLKDLL
ncbi:Ethylene-responsive transcription factor-like protein At4g13040, partial [Durusdinium trenchii]